MSTEIPAERSLALIAAALCENPSGYDTDQPQACQACTSCHAIANAKGQGATETAIRTALLEYRASVIRTITIEAGPDAGACLLEQAANAGDPTATESLDEPTLIERAQNIVYTAEAQLRRDRKAQRDAAAFRRERGKLMLFDPVNQAKSRLFASITVRVLANKTCIAGDEHEFTMLAIACMTEAQMAIDSPTIQDAQHEWQWNHSNLTTWNQERDRVYKMHRGGVLADLTEALATVTGGTPYEDEWPD